MLLKSFKCNDGKLNYSLFSATRASAIGQSILQNIKFNLRKEVTYMQISVFEPLESMSLIMASAAPMAEQLAVKSAVS